jgi:predicted small lipoprotein YifL
VPVSVLPALFAVRACSQGRKGPVGLPVTVTAPQPEPVSILS